jgi:hypothetical protein
MRGLGGRAPEYAPPDRLIWSLTLAFVSEFTIGQLLARIELGDAHLRLDNEYAEQLGLFMLAARLLGC